MRSVAATSLGDRDAGAALAEQSTARGRRSRGARPRTPRPTTRSALSFENTDPTRALRLLDRSVQHAEAVDNRWIRAFALTESLWIRAKSGRARSTRSRATTT